MRKYAYAVLFALVAAVAMAARPPSQAATLQLPAEPTQVASFSSSYVIGGRRYAIIGHEPSAAGSHPLYVFLCGSRGNVSTTSPELAFTSIMAGRGFVAAMIEYPGLHFLTMDHAAPAVGEQVEESDEPAPQTIGLQCQGQNAIVNTARMIFAYGRPEDANSSANSSGAFATLCARDGVDCTAGIAVHGHSLGGLLSAQAAHFTPYVTASLVWGAGTDIPGAHSCCGMASGNRSCCVAGRPIGGQPLECMEDQERSQYLPRSKRLIVIGSGDAYYDEANSSQPAIEQAVNGSGYDCMGGRTCVQADGSGFVLPSGSQIGTNVSYMRHNFYMRATREDEDLGGGYILNPSFVSTEEPWGLAPSLAWLARAALMLH